MQKLDLCEAALQKKDIALDALIEKLQIDAFASK